MKKVLSILILFVIALSLLGCGESGYDETHHYNLNMFGSKVDLEEHIFNVWSSEKSATCTEKGEEYSKCEKCEYVAKRAPKLLVPLNQRIELLKKNGAEDVFVIDFNRDFANLEAGEFLRVFCLDNAVKIDCICVGKNWRFGKNGAGDTVLLEKFCQANNIDCRLIEELKIDSEKISSANIRIAVANGFLDKVRNMLGRPYFIHGTVVKGFSFAGDKLGHPTANLKPDSEILPPDGVYAAKAVIDDAEYLAAVNIGVAPSFDFNCRNHRIEVHLLDFDGNLYGRELDIMLLKYLRNERFFESAEALKEQIIKDIQQIKSLK